MKNRKLAFGSLALSALAFALLGQGCGSSGPAGAACEPGDTRACVGPAACAGGQSCAVDGNGFTPCDCGSTTSSSSSATGAASASSASASSSTAGAGGASSASSASASSGTGGAPCEVGETACGGACTNTSTDAMNCGACGTTCTNPNGTISCISSACVPVCTAGHDDCDGQATNGCEADLTLDPVNCGTCGKSCPAAPNSNATCLASTCGLGACKNGFGDCNLDPSDGCEVDFSTDGVNCGGCGIDCLGGGCNNKVCGPVPTMLASGQSAPEGIAVDATSVYWANQSGTIQKVPLNGGEFRHARDRTRRGRLHRNRRDERVLDGQ